jgi:ribonuclease E
MDATQEEVYGWMGLNPALLLDPMPTGDNVVMRVVRPGCDPEAVLEEARQQSSSYGSRRRRRGRGGGETRSTPSDAGPSASESETDEGVSPSLAPAAELVTVEVPAHRRARALEDRAEEAAQEAAIEASPAGEAAEESGEPRRRRRRSSATV